jgi:hypothetical protein
MPGRPRFGPRAGAAAGSSRLDHGRDTRHATPMSWLGEALDQVSRALHDLAFRDFATAR